MILNLFDLSIKSNYQGTFHDIKEVNGHKTNSLPKMLDKEKKSMENMPFIEDLKLLLSQRYNNNVDSLSKSTGISIEQINKCLNGLSEPIPELLQEIQKNKKTHRTGDNIQIGDKIEINNAGNGMTNNYKGMLEGINKENIQKMKSEIADLHKIIKEKDELIAALKENIKLLKNKKEGS